MKKRRFRRHSPTYTTGEKTGLEFLPDVMNVLVKDFTKHNVQCPVFMLIYTVDDNYCSSKLYVDCFETGKIPMFFERVKWAIWHITHRFKMKTIYKLRKFDIMKHPNVEE